MAPVFDQVREEEDASLRLRRQELWQGSARHTDDKERRDGPESDDEGSDDEGYDSDDDERKGGKVQKEQGSGGVILGINPLNPLPGVASGFASLIAAPSPSPTPVFSTSELYTSTTSSSTVSTTSSSSTSSTSSLSLPTLSVNNPLALNPQASVPQVVTMSSVTIMTTTSIATPSVMPLVTPSPSFINSIFPSMQPATSSNPTPALENDLPSPTIFLTDTDNDYHHDNDPHDDNFSGPPPSGLSPTGEDVLISAGSIGKPCQSPRVESGLSKSC